MATLSSIRKLQLIHEQQHRNIHAGAGGAALISPSAVAGSPAQSTPHVHTMGENMAYTSGPLSAFNTKVIIVTACLLLVLIFALVINIFTRWFLRRLLSSSNPHRDSSFTIGLKLAHLNSLPTTTYNQTSPCPLSSSTTNTPQVDLDSPTPPSACPICLVDLKNGDRIRVLPKCEHRFHVPCIDPWLLKHASCPTCRGDLMDTIIKTLPTQASQS